MELIRVRGSAVEFWCPACQCLHRVPIGPNGWEYVARTNTLWPSVKVEGGDANGPTICHSFVVNGHINYMHDCTHSYCGAQSVPMQDIPEGATI
jgi:hypothetical protein